MKGGLAAILLALSAISAFAQNSGASPLLLIDPHQTADKSTANSTPSNMPPAEAGVDPSTLVQRYGRIIDRRPAGAGGLTIWTVEKNGQRLIIYTIGDGQAKK